MNFYFASASANWRAVRYWQEYARASGHTISFDWTPMVEEYGRGDPHDTNPEILLQAAVKDLRGVAEATHFVNLWSEDQCGALIETGAAIIDDTPVWIVGNPRYAIFWELPNVETISERELRWRLENLG